MPFSLLDAASPQVSVRSQALHDLNAPFAVVKHLLKKKNLLNDQHLSSALKRLELLIEEVRRNEKHTTLPNKKPLQEILKNVIAEKSSLLNGDIVKDLKIEHNLDKVSDFLFVPGSEFELARVFSNIIDNAIDAIPHNKEGLIRICVRSLPGEVSISICDNGVGMNSDLFTVIGRAPVTYNKEGGSGRGLYYSKRVIAQLDGSIQFTNNDGCGLTVDISLPILH